MTDTRFIRIAGVALMGAVILFTIALFLETRPTYASAPSGLNATVATTSPLTIGPTDALNVSLFGATTTTNNGCAARIITTTATPIMLEFTISASTTASGTVGHLQGASTTVAYDGGQYGCGLWTAYAFATTTITVTETK